MIREFLSDQGLTLGPMVALLLFLSVFLGVLVWVYRPGSKATYEHEARLPFDDPPPRPGDESTVNEDR